MLGFYPLGGAPLGDDGNLSPVGGLIKVWNGSAWVDKPVKVWNGSSWVAKPLKFWNGTSWELS